MSETTIVSLGCEESCHPVADCCRALSVEVITRKILPFHLVPSSVYLVHRASCHTQSTPIIAP